MAKTSFLRRALQEARDPRSIKTMAAEVGVDPNTWGAYERGERFPDLVFLNKVHEKTGYPLAQLVNALIDDALGAGSGLRVPEAGGPLGLSEGERATYGPGPSSEFSMIPRFDIEASAGPGAFVDRENVLDFMAFRTEWIRRDLRAEPSKLVLIRAVGDSMEPAIRAGDLLLVDTSVEAFIDDAIYVVVFDGALLVKRIQRFFGGAVTIRSDNTAYVEQTLTAEEAAGVHVAGRVRWIGRLI